MANLRIAFISSEIFPFAKTGGLADVIGSLAPTLHEDGEAPILILPKYRVIDDSRLKPLDITIPLQMGGYRFEARAWKTFHPKGVETYLLDIPEFYNRDQLYGEGGRDYFDNCFRFASFSQAALHLLKILNLRCDVIHIHDWQTALIPFYLKTIFADDPFFKNTRSVLTIHNLGYQGLFPAMDLPLTGLDWGYYTPRYMEYYGKINLLKSGIISADALTTVSPTYAKEILTPEFGFGLDGVLRSRQEALRGILNGIDTDIWNPATDHHLPVTYSSHSLDRKEECKTALQQEMELPINSQLPLFALMSRLVQQKGIDLVIKAIPYLISMDMQLIIHGVGDAECEKTIRQMAELHPRKIAAKVGYYDESLAHRIEAGADFFLMPSRYEPCGLTQMYSLRYGTIPIVHKVGGLADTVIDVHARPGKGTGFHFTHPRSDSLNRAVARAMELFGAGMRLDHVRTRAMRQDFSWKKPADEYMELYDHILSRPKTEIPRGL